MSKESEKKFLRCVFYIVLWILALFTLHTLAPDAPLPEYIFTGGLVIAFFAGLLTG